MTYLSVARDLVDVCMANNPTREREWMAYHSLARSLLISGLAQTHMSKTPLPFLDAPWLLNDVAILCFISCDLIAKHGRTE
jgi:hypothetical protein